MKKSLLGFVLLCLTFSTAVKAQNLFTPISDNEAGLTPAQLTKLQNLRTNPAYESLTMVQVGNVATLQHDGSLIVNVPGKPQRMAVAYAIENPSKSLDGDFKWEGSFFIDTSVGGVHDTTGDGEITIYRKNGIYYGNISLPFDPDSYELTSFAPGKNVLIKYNLQHTQHSTCGTPADDQPNTTERVTSSGCGSTVKVLVLYTGAAANAVVDIATTAQHCIDDMNGTIINSVGSTQDLSYELIGVRQSSITERLGAAINTLDAFRADLDARNWRDQFGADLMILLTDGNFTDPTYPSYSVIGLSYSNGPDVEKAYSIVEADAANDNYTLNHEIGHDMGARHQQSWISQTNYADDATGYSHGYKMKRGFSWFSSNTNYITMMHENIGIKHSHLFSTPYQQIWSKDMGTLDENYNAKTVIDNACTVAAYRPENSENFKAHIQPDHYLNMVGSNVHFTATTNNVGIQPYTYNWSVSSDGFTWTSLPSLGITADYTMPNKKRIYVMVDIHDAMGVSALTTNHVNGAIGNAFDPYNWVEPVIFRPGTGRTAHIESPDGLEVYPSPANDVIIVSYIAEKNNIVSQVRIFSTDGKQIYSGSIDQSNTSRQIDVSTFANGLYFVELSNSKTTQVVKFVLNH